MPGNRDAHLGTSKTTLEHELEAAASMQVTVDSPKEECESRQMKLELEQSLESNQELRQKLQVYAEVCAEPIKVS